MTGLLGGGPRPSVRQTTVRGRVIEPVPADETESLWVVLPNYSETLAYEVVAGRWPGSTGVPVAGADCLVVFDDENDAWAPFWSGL
jgi:hypothetical protein